MRGEELRPDQALLLANARQRAEGERRAPKPIVDLEHTLLVLDRGSRAEVRIAVRRYRGSRPFLDVRRWEQTPEGLRPTRQGVSIRAREVTGLLATLGRATRWLASAAG